MPSSFQRILYEDLRLHPYKIHITHKLKEQDKSPHANFCRQFLDLVDNDEGVFDVLIMSDETHFHMSIYRIFSIGTIKIPFRSTRNLSIVKR